MKLRVRFLKVYDLMSPSSFTKNAMFEKLHFLTMINNFLLFYGLPQGNNLNNEIKTKASWILRSMIKFSYRLHRDTESSQLAPKHFSPKPEFN